MRVSASVSVRVSVRECVSGARTLGKSGRSFAWQRASTCRPQPTIWPRNERMVIIFDPGWPPYSTPGGHNRNRDGR